LEDGAKGARAEASPDDERDRARAADARPQHAQHGGALTEVGEGGGGGSDGDKVRGRGGAGGGDGG